MPSAIVLTEREEKLLQAVFERVRNSLVNTPSRPSAELTWTEGADHQAPEVYIAKPRESIPAIEAAEATGTGTSSPSLSYALCDIYRIVETEVGPVLRQVPGLRHRVYNISSAEIDNSTWISVQRTKYGHWIPTTGSGTNWGFGKANTTFTEGAVTSGTVADDKGPAYNSGDGEPTGDTITPDWCFDEEIAQGDWVWWESKYSRTYIGKLYPCDLAVGTGSGS